ncbi:MAE_28990/MAE_18760 family HEPN-like nuclease [Iningainema tapete]|uniref:MAE_28990/MAE_18760 family HEPN-like nuclease n=1 Tax=Iningainema tapete TaxID=2806730 RepID=UPI003B5893F8
MHQYGFFGRIEVDNKRVKYILDHIVKMRCDLAHGNVSFRWAASGKVMNEIVAIKDDTIQYLENLLQNISEFINQKKYKGRS